MCLLPFLCLARAGGEPVRNLSDEEVRLIEAYRRDPEPFRRLVREQEERHASHRGAGEPVLGPRDVIDVAIEGGSVAFFGRNYAYDPVAFRIARGQEIEVVFRRQRSSFETAVRVSYRPDGLHFDVPEPRPGAGGPERGCLVLPEDPRWSKGEPITQGARLDSRLSRSRADHLTFHIRYALLR